MHDCHRKNPLKSGAGLGAPENGNPTGMYIAFGLLIGMETTDCTVYSDAEPLT